MLTDNQALLVQVLNTLPDAIVICNADGNITVLNQAAREFYGFSEDVSQRNYEANEFSLYRFDGQTQLPKTENPLYRALQGENIHDVGLTIYPPQRASRTVIANGNPLVNSTGKIVGAVMTMRDITSFVDRSEIGASFTEQEDLLRNIFNGIGAAVFTIDVDKDMEFRFSSLNPNGSIIFGLTPSDVLYRTPVEVLSPEIAQEVIGRCLTCVELKEQQTYETDLTFTRFTNNYRISLYPVFNKHGDVYRIIVTLVDITEQKLMLQELSSALHRADAANQAKGQFLANISHELRTPLNAILGYSQLLARDTNLSDQQRITLTTINRSGEHLLRLINDVLDLTKIDSGQIELQSEVCDLYRLLDDIYQMMSVRAKAKQICFDFELDPDLPRFISIDTNKLRQIIINLLGNALKFTSEGEVRLHVTAITPIPSIPVSLGSDPDYKHPLQQPLLRLTVSDTGTGIAPEEIEQLFKPFVQTDSGHHQTEGSGLGLAISRRFARLMGGDIEVASQKHHGSQFLLTVAFEEAEESQIQFSERSHVVDGLAEGEPVYRILLVDDRFENRDILHRLLGNIGLDIQQARDGREAIELWELWQPHLIFMDIRMPVMDGLQATRAIRDREPNRTTKILALTASAFSSDLEAVLAAGCDGFLVKPFKVPEIFEQLHDHLGVAYRYREEVAPETAPLPTANLTLLADDLRGLNPSWLLELKQACLEGDDLAAEELVRAITDDYQKTASILSSLIAEFHFDRILEWIEMDATLMI